MEPSQEEPAQLPPKHAAPEKAPRPPQQDIPIVEDLAPRAITLQDVRKYGLSRLPFLPTGGGRATSSPSP